MDLCVFCPSWEVEDIPPCPLTAHKRNMCIQQAARQSNSKVCSPSGTGGMQEFTFLISRGRIGLITIRLWTQTAHARAVRLLRCRKASVSACEV